MGKRLWALLVLGSALLSAIAGPTNGHASDNSSPESLIGMGRINETIMADNQSLKLYPNDTMSLSMNASALIASGRYKEALEYLNASILIDPESPFAWKEKAAALYKLGRYSESLKNVNMSILLDSRYAEAWQIKGATLEALGLYSPSNAAYSKAYGDVPYARIGASEAPIHSALESEEYVVGQGGP